MSILLSPNKSIISATGQMSYSVNSGASFTPFSGSVALLAAQDMTHVQVRGTLTANFSDGSSESRTTTWSGFPAASGVPTAINLYEQSVLAFDSSQATHGVKEVWAEVTA